MPSNPSIIERIKASPKIPAPSHTVFKILELTNDPDCPAKKVADVIAGDGGLTAELLRQSNSALYGFSTATSSPLEACVRLGLKRVRSAVINQHIVNGLGKTKPEGFDANKYWQSTLATSVAAKDLCRQIAPAQAEDACTAGLLCDVGIGMLAFGVPKDYTPVLAHFARSGEPLHRIERRLLEINHAEVASLVLEGWRLDPQILAAVKHHHFDLWELAPQKPERFPRIVAAAVTLSEIALGGSDMDRVGALFTQIEALSKDPDSLVNKLLDGLVGRIQQTADAFSVELGSMADMQANFDDVAKAMPEGGIQMSFTPMARQHFE